MKLKPLAGLLWIVAVPAVAEVIARCEDAGFDGVGVHDHPHSGRDAYLVLALAAARTRRIQLYPATSSPVVRHPVLLASLAQSLDEIAPGRVCLTVAPGFLSARSVGRRRATVDATDLERLEVRMLENEADVIAKSTAVRHLVALGYEDPLEAAMRQAAVERSQRAQLAGAEELLKAGDATRAIAELESMIDDAGDWAAPHQLLGACQAFSALPTHMLCRDDRRSTKACRSLICAQLTECRH